MIAVVPYLCEEGKSSPRRIPASAIDRLMEDLALQDHQATPPPSEALRRQVFERIDQEPARVETDLQGRIQAINPAFSGLCGYSFQEVKGRKPGSFLQGPETDAAAIQTLRDAIAALCPVDVSLTNYHKNGSPYKVWISITPKRDEDGKVVGFSAIEKKL
jgi:PAS domain S-box-containing protein